MKFIIIFETIVLVPEVIAITFKTVLLIVLMLVAISHQAVTHMLMTVKLLVEATKILRTKKMHFFQKNNLRIPLDQKTYHRLKAENMLDSEIQPMFNPPTRTRQTYMTPSLP